MKYPVPGETLQHYTNLEKLGEGGMGVVFKARDTRLNRTVVIKALHPDKARDADPRRRFFQEAQAASALNHPNIVTVYDIGSENGVDFIVMEYVNGSPDGRSAPGRPAETGIAASNTAPRSPTPYRPRIRPVSSIAILSPAIS